MTAAELESLDSEQYVWYEFQPGDVIPVQFGFLGAVEGGSNGDSLLRAKHTFYFVTAKNGPVKLSFDGKTLAADNTNQSVVAVVPRADGKGGQLVWMIYMGKDANPEKELDRMLAEPAAK